MLRYLLILLIGCAIGGDVLSVMGVDHPKTPVPDPGEKDNDPGQPVPVPTVEVEIPPDETAPPMPYDDPTLPPDDPYEPGDWEEPYDSTTPIPMEPTPAPTIAPVEILQWRCDRLCRPGGGNWILPCPDECSVYGY